MKKFLKYLFFGFLFSCGQEYPAQKHVPDEAFDAKLASLLNHSVPEITVDEAKNSETKVVFFDARGESEFNTSHIPGAIFVGYKDLDRSIVDKTPKDEAIVVYCSVGYRSEKIAEKLIEMGFTNVTNLYGGIFEWKNTGNTVVNEKGETEKVHTYSRSWGKWLKKGEKVY